MPLRDRLAWMLPLLGTAGFFFLLSHRSASPSVGNRYSSEYAALLLLYGLNLVLLWAGRFRRRRAATDGTALGGAALGHSAFGGTASGTLAGHGALLLLVVIAGVALMMLIDASAGPRAAPKSYWLLVALIGGLLVQMSHRWPLARGGGSASRPAGVALAAVLAIAVLVRAYGIDFGLPFSYEADEHVFMNIAARIAAGGDLDPRWFGHPGTTTIYLLSGLMTVLFHFGAAFGLVDRAAGFESFFNEHPAVTYLGGRILSLIFGVATVFLTYVITRRIFNRSTALGAAAFLAVSPLHVSYSRIIRTDILVGLLALVVFWFCLDILVRRQSKSYFLAGLFTGIGVATKYPMIIVSVTVLAAHLLGPPGRLRHAAKLVIYGGGVLIGAFVASPYMFLDYRNALADVLFEANPDPATTMLWPSEQGLVQDFIWYVRVPLVDALSSLGLALAGAGLLLCLRSRRKETLLLTTFPVFLLGSVVWFGPRWARWLIPALPFLCIMASHTATRMADWIRMRVSLPAGDLAAAMLVLGVSMPLLGRDLEESRRLRLPDTRTLARTWVMDNVPAASRLLIEANAPILPGGRYEVYQVNWSGVLKSDKEENPDEGMLGPFTRNVAVHTEIRPHGHLGRVENLDVLRRLDADYLILTNVGDRYRARSKLDPRCAEVVTRYETLAGMGTKVAEFDRQPGRTQGPRITIYRL
jgi:Dolichyl-phosphate-mannose-protein mannosyltransferase